MCQDQCKLLAQHTPEMFASGKIVILKSIDVAALQPHHPLSHLFTQHSPETFASSKIAMLKSPASPWPYRNLTTPTVARLTLVLTLLLPGALHQL